MDWIFQSFGRKKPGINTRSFVRTKKILYKTNNFGFKTRNSGFQKHEVSGRENEVSVRKTRSFGSKIPKFRFENPKFRYENPKFRFKTPKFRIKFLNSKLSLKLSSRMLRWRSPKILNYCVAHQIFGDCFFGKQYLIEIFMISRHNVDEFHQAQSFDIENYRFC
jgi:hypothetical protein